MLTLKSLPNISIKHRGSVIGFVGAAMLHTPLLLFAFGMDFHPQKLDDPNKEIGAMHFSLASFAPKAAPEPLRQAALEPVKTIPKHYAPKKEKQREKEKEEKKVVKKEHKHKKEHKDIEQKVALKDIPKVNNNNALQNSVAQSQTQNVQPTVLGSNNKNPFLAQIKELIDSHNTYPRMARKRGISGIVVVKMVLEENGNIKELRVIESSTHTILDNQTIKAIQEASKFFPKPDKTYILHIPIEYELKSA